MARQCQASHWWIQSNPPGPEGAIWHPTLESCGNMPERQRRHKNPGGKQKGGTWCFWNFADLPEFFLFLIKPINSFSFTSLHLRPTARGRVKEMRWLGAVVMKHEKTGWVKCHTRGQRDRCEWFYLKSHAGGVRWFFTMIEIPVSPINTKRLAQVFLKIFISINKLYF